MIQTIFKVFIVCCFGFVVTDIVLYALVKIKEKKKPNIVADADYKEINEQKKGE